MKILHQLFQRVCFCALILAAASPLCAAESGGSLSGQVQNGQTGATLEKAEVSLVGTPFTTLTDDTGQFRLIGLPAGPATLRVFYTGLAPQNIPVQIAPDQPVIQNVSLFSPTKGGEDKTVVLDPYVVAAAQSMSNEAIAINEQRFSPNIKSVVATDGFNEVTGGNVAEFLKFLPGVSVDMGVGSESRTAQVRGLPSYTLPVSIDGNRQASSASAGTTRNFEFEQISINNFGRVEVTKSETPDAPADAVGGWINLITRRAFDFTHPTFSYSTYINFNSTAITANRTPGPGEDDTYKIHPDAEFIYTFPVTKKFGFSITGVYSRRYNPQDSVTPLWVPSGGAGTTGGSSFASPALQNFTIAEAPADTTREGLGATLDYKLGPNDAVSLTSTLTDYHSLFYSRLLQFLPGSVASYSPTSTQGNAGAGSVQYDTFNRDKVGKTLYVAALYRHTGAIWKIDAGAYESHSENYYRDADKGFLYDVRLTLARATIRYDNINKFGPGTITTTDASGSAEDWRQLNNYTLSLEDNAPSTAVDVVRGAHLNSGRDFQIGSVPLTLKVGGDIRQDRRDIRAPTNLATFVGPDGVANSADDSASRYNILDVKNSQTPSLYNYGTIQWPDPSKAAQLMKAHPEYFVENVASDVSSSANNSKLLIETVSSGYVRFDTHLLSNKLWIVTGVRYEGTNENGYGVSNDITRTYQRDANGKIIFNGNTPLTIAGLNAGQLAALQYVDRGLHVRDNYGSFYPSLNVTYNLTPDLLLRGAITRTISRPDLSNIVPSVVLPVASTAGGGTIAVNNTALKPWTSINHDVSLEYYFGTAGVLSVGVFDKEITNFFGAITTLATPELLNQYGLDPTLYANYNMTFKANAGTAKVKGGEFNYKQDLTFLPAWAQGLQLFTNATKLSLQGSTIADFSGFISTNFNYGIRLFRPRYSVTLAWNYRGRQRNAPIVGAGVEPGTYEYALPRTYLDLTSEYRILPWLRLFASVRNITNTPQTLEHYGPSTPAYARLEYQQTYGAQWAVGVKGTY